MRLMYLILLLALGCGTVDTPTSEPRCISCVKFFWRTVKTISWSNISDGFNFVKKVKAEPNISPEKALKELAEMEKKLADLDPPTGGENQVLKLRKEIQELRDSLSINSDATYQALTQADLVNLVKNNNIYGVKTETIGTHTLLPLYNGRIKVLVSGQGNFMEELQSNNLELPDRMMRYVKSVNDGEPNQVELGGNSYNKLSKYAHEFYLGRENSHRSYFCVIGTTIGTTTTIILHSIKHKNGGKGQDTHIRGVKKTCKGLATQA